MSLVGPRPEVPRYVSRYTLRQKAILTVKPGITGLSTHQFRNEEELLAQQQDKEEFYITRILPAKLDIDLAYCGTITFWRDLKLIFATLAGLSGIMPVRSQQEI
jgi:lipopolysaccharide/colanic/teichoic acid biosynthesis glycosyltransferase